MEFMTSARVRQNQSTGNIVLDVKPQSRSAARRNRSMMA